MNRRYPYSIFPVFFVFMCCLSCLSLSNQDLIWTISYGPHISRVTIVNMNLVKKYTFILDYLSLKRWIVRIKMKVLRKIIAEKTHPYIYIRSLDTIMLTSWAPHSLLFPCKEGAGRSTYLCPCPLWNPVMAFFSLSWSPWHILKY